MIKLKELEKSIQELVDNFEECDYKLKALSELSNFDDVKFEACRHIVNDYPDFNHIELKITNTDAFVFKLCINPKYMKDKKTIRKLAKAFRGWLKYCSWSK